jgi:hypothetical protein
MDKCKDCIEAIHKYHHQSPVGWIPFAWGPSTESPTHFYVLPENTPEPEDGVPQQVDVLAICMVSNGVARDIPLEEK